MSKIKFCLTVTIQRLFMLKYRKESIQILQGGERSLKKRFILDMTMLFVFLIVVGYKPLGNYWHETLGMVLCFGVFAQLLEQAVVQVFEEGTWGLERKYTAAWLTGF